MGRVFAVLVALSATSATAELNDRQQAAFDIVLPALTEALGEQGGDDVAEFAPALAECVVTTAKRKEVRALGDSELSEDDMSLINDIMTRPKTQGCLTRALQ